MLCNNKWRKMLVDCGKMQTQMHLAAGISSYAFAKLANGELVAAFGLFASEPHVSAISLTSWS